MDESIIRSCVLFLSLNSPDPAKVFPAAEIISDALRRKKARHKDKSYQALLVSEASKFLKPERWQKIPPHTSHRLDLSSYSGLIGQIRYLKTKLKINEFEAFIWVECLNIPVQEVASGLNTTEGTIKYRAYRGLKRWAEVE